MQTFIDFIFDRFQDLAHLVSLFNISLRGLISQYAPIVANNNIYIGFASSHFGSFFLDMTPLAFFGIGSILVILVLHLVHLLNVIAG